jgi:N-acetylneuraminate synthase
MKAIRISDRLIGPEHPPFIIAEMSGNHNQSLDRALQIVEAAAKAGAHAIKLQTYTADTMTLDIREGEFVIQDPNSLWYGRSLYDLYQEAHTPWEWHKPIFDRAKELGIIAFSTPFDATAVDFLEELGTPAYKIASFENGDIALIEKAASTGKPVIISTGMADAAGILEAVSAVKQTGNEDAILLHCTSTYPASPANSNLRSIPYLREVYQTQVGLSDHTLGIGVPVASVAFGATVIEKHFTLARAEGGVDAAFSLEPSEMRTLVEESARAHEALGSVQVGPTSAENPSIRFRRSLYVTKDVNSGETLTHKNVRAIRPGFGLEPKYLEMVLGKKFTRDVEKGTPLRWELF